ncbi:hypothetical protein [Lichenicoccus sp.]|uniref:hypothetical protein n=1 Tax=Lichenicoccus sp. TaxID=2781899 RepID=UPI003D0E6453
MQIAFIAPPPVRPTSAPDSVAAPAASSAIAASGLVRPLTLNPDLHLDPSLGIVVTEYFNAVGKETQQFPAVQAIQRYQLFGLNAAGPDAP